MTRFYFASTRDGTTYRINVGEATATTTDRRPAKTVSVDEIAPEIEYTYSVEAETIEEALNPMLETEKVWTGERARSTARQVANRKW